MWQHGGMHDGEGRGNVWKEGGLGGLCEGVCERGLVEGGWDGGVLNGGRVVWEGQGNE